MYIYTQFSAKHVCFVTGLLTTTTTKTARTTYTLTHKGIRTCMGQTDPPTQIDTHTHQIDQLSQHLRPLQRHHSHATHPLTLLHPATYIQGPFRIATLAAAARFSRGTGQTTVNKKAPIHYIISINDKVYRPL